MATSSHTNRRRSWLWRYRRLLFLVWLGTFTLASGAAFILAQVPLPAEAAPSQTTILLDRNGDRLASLDVGENRVNVPLERVPEVVVDAVLATEDKNFFRHSGVDPVGVARATLADIRGKGSLQGGSTITQQYVKNTYVGRERTIWRKLREAVLSVKLERRLQKEEILERYLNTIYLGRGAYGVQAASRAYFNKDVDDLSLREAAYLAGLIRAPEAADAARDPEAAEARRSRTLAAMVRNGRITSQQQEQVESEPITAYVVDREEQEPTVVAAETGTNYFVEYVRSQLVQRFGPQVLGIGLRVTTTLDLEAQGQANHAVYGLLDREDDPAGALIAVDDTGAIRAMVGGRDWATSKVNLAVGRDGGGTGRQAGSTFKPILLAQAVREGYSVQATLPAPPSIILPKADNGKDWKVANYEDAEYGETLNLVDATRVSANTVYAQLVKAVGEEDLVTMARDMGVRSPLEPYPSLVLGTVDVSVLDMAAAYSTLANRGMRVEPHAVLEVHDALGNRLAWTREAPVRVLEREQADVVTHCLRQAVERGTGVGAKFGKPFAGKTGTTQDYGDAWFVGYTPKLTTAVWMGYPEGNSRKMTSVRGKKISGGTLPATIFKRFMAEVTEGVDTGEFVSPTKFGGKPIGKVDAVIPTTSTSSTSTPEGETTSTTAEGERDKPATTTTAPRPSTTAPPTTAPPTTPPPPPSTTTTSPPRTTTTSTGPPP